MANAIRSGFSFLQAMDMASQEMPAPLSKEWKIALKEMQLGVTIEQALDNLTIRVGSADLDLMVTAIIIQAASRWEFIRGFGQYPRHYQGQIAHSKRNSDFDSPRAHFWLHNRGSSFFYCAHAFVH